MNGHRQSQIIGYFFCYEIVALAQLVHELSQPEMDGADQPLRERLVILEGLVLDELSKLCGSESLNSRPLGGRTTNTARLTKSGLSLFLSACFFLLVSGCFFLMALSVLILLVVGYSCWYWGLSGATALLSSCWSWIHGVLELVSWKERFWRRHFLGIY